MKPSRVLAFVLIGFLVGIMLSHQLFQPNTGLNSQHTGVVSPSSGDGAGTRSSGGTSSDSNLTLSGCRLVGKFMECTAHYGNGTTGTIVMANPLCLGPNSWGWYVGDDVGTLLPVLTVPASSMMKDSLSWWKNAYLPGNETFRVKAVNPTGASLLAQVDFVIHEPDGCRLFFASPSFSLNAGQRTDLSFNYKPIGGPGKYCFAASLVYGVDTNNDRVLDGYEPTDAAIGHTGCFSYE